MRSFVLFLVACGGGQAIPPTAESCAAICAADAKTEPAPAPAPDPAPSAGGSEMSDYEMKLLGPVLEDIRGGVRPYDDQGIGICKGKDKCDKFIGTDVGELAKGDYILQAVLAVPKQGEGWKMTLATECTTTKGDSTTNKSNTKDYDVKYAGEGRGYNLVPLRRIESPGKYGAQECTYTITAPHPDGDKVYEGKWSVPDGS